MRRRLPSASRKGLAGGGNGRGGSSDAVSSRIEGQAESRPTRQADARYSNQGSGANPSGSVNRCFTGATAAAMAG